MYRVLRIFLLKKLQLKVRSAILKLVLIILWNKDMTKKKAIIIILKILANLKIHYLRPYEREV